jgi:hypothetical protein
MLPRMARVGALHRLGILVVDEIQNLNEAKSGGDKRMLNFFVQLVNTMGLPVVLIGTPKARPLLMREFRQARRSTGQGVPVWNTMAFNEIWQLFVESLWRYQYVQQPVALTAPLSQTFYDETQGITDFVIKLFMLAQIRAIVTGQERITVEIVRSVAADSLSFARLALSALRRGDHAALQQFEDLQPLDIEPYLEQARLDQQTRARAKLAKAASATSEANPPPTIEPGASADRQRVSSPQDLRNLIDQASDLRTSAYEACQAAGVTRPATDYLKSEADDDRLFSGSIPG